MDREELIETASKLASRGYSKRIIKDRTTDGEEIFIAVNPELDGCMAQGETIEDAEAILEEVRVDCIAHLLEHGLYVPEPQETDTGDAMGLYSTVFQIDVEPRENDIQLEEGEILFETSPKPIVTSNI